MDKLIQLFVDCEALLRSVGESFWADKIKGALQKVQKYLDLYFLEEIISWYGGMGSFNDLIISEYNNHLIDDKDEEKLNNELTRLRSAIYQVIVRLKRDLSE